ncbi:MAG: phage tail protein [Pseudobutyrivibrio sp.]|nr:phage tail protein [Pseudobutyrivibrio sp.]
MVDRIITLFESTEREFNTNGIGPLPDAISCSVTEETNSVYELEMVYPISGMNYSELTFRRLLYAKPNPYSNRQPFRIYALSKPLDGQVTINARHISYDLSDYTASPFSAISVVSAFTNLRNAVDVEDFPFEFWTDKETAVEMETTVPLSVRSILGGIEGSILDTYRGEYEFDGFTVKLWNHRGTDRGVSINYGKNLTSLKQDENCSDVYTAVRPYWYRESNSTDPDIPDENSGYVELHDKIIMVDQEADYVKILPLDLTNDLQEKPTEEELRAAAVEYIEEHDIGTPKVSLDVSFVNLSDADEYNDLALLEMVKLCDTVDVVFPKLGVNVSAKVNKTVYNVLSGRYDSIELGESKADLTRTISINNKTIKERVTKTDLEQAVSIATNLITGQSGGYVVLNPAEQPQELLILDTPTLETAVNVWRWNSGGLGFSSHGYTGPYTTAITSDGKIVADFILAGTMSANLIKGGVLQLGSRLNQNGALEVYDETNTLISSLDKNGLRMYGTDGFYLSVTPEDGFAGFDGRTSPPTKLFWVNEDEFHQKKSVVEEEITLFNKMRFIPIELRDSNNQVVNDGVALVSVAT